MPPNPLTLDGSALSIRDVVDVAVSRRPVRLDDSVRTGMARSRQVVESVCEGEAPRYGINTGFGSLSRRRIPPADLAQLQRNLIRSHSAGVGPHLPEPVVRGMMLAQAASISRGASGARPAVVDAILAMLNAGVTPAVPETGSVGASGDLAPLAAATLALIGEGDSYFEGSCAPTAEALARAGLQPLALEAKEGLALINGTHLMAARGALLLDELDTLFHAAVLACAMSIDAAKATDAFLDPRVHALRRQPGQADIAAALRAGLEGSQIIPSHREDDPRVQDPYSFRCAPPVLGAALDAARGARLALECELGAVTDNPLVIDGDIISAGNFHGMPLAIPLDTLAIAAAHLAGISERRVFAMLAAADPFVGLQPYLAPHPGLQSGLMIAQYTAAACCNELIGLANPASVANISTSAGIEDYNSFGPRAAAKAARAVELARWVVAIELLCAGQGIDLHRPLRSGGPVEAFHATMRAVVPRLDDDRPLTPDIEALTALIRRSDVIPDAIPSLLLR
ncbi:MAG: histidine ammonia-lyase [Phycisphaerales bacterium]|nr:histidine ammonia-lyase [Phycisphaerales bacterium]